MYFVLLKKTGFKKERMTVRHDHGATKVYSPKFCGLFFAFSAITLLGAVGFYLSSINAIAIAGNDSNRYEKTIDDLSKQQHRMQVETAELSSLYRLQDQQGQYQPIAPEQVLYVTVSGPLALR